MLINSSIHKYSGHCCLHCGKGYKTRTNLEKHVNLCELLHKGKKSGICVDDVDKLPSQKQMFQMLLELGQKYNKLEEKVDEINKWVVKKKKKINIVEWLNTNMVPNLVFEKLHEKITIIDSDIQFLLENSLLDTINEVFTRTIYNMEEEFEIKIPMFAFVQKANIFYIFDKNGNNMDDDDDKNVWMELHKDKLMRFLMRVQMKISKAFCEWKKKKADKKCGDDHFDMLCDKTIVKIMGTEFNQDATISKMKAIMYNKMKADMKALIEYEFEF
jgi:hypothetical protein